MKKWWDNFLSYGEQRGHTVALKPTDQIWIDINKTQNQGNEDGVDLKLESNTIWVQKQYKIENNNSDLIFQMIFFNSQLNLLSVSVWDPVRSNFVAMIGTFLKNISDIDKFVKT